MHGKTWHPGCDIPDIDSTIASLAVALALPLDVMRIEDSGLINPGWRQRVPNNGVVAESVVSIVYRKGNPKQIRGWDDLTRLVASSWPLTQPSSERHSQMLNASCIWIWAIVMPIVWLLNTVSQPKLQQSNSAGHADTCNIQTGTFGSPHQHSTLRRAASHAAYYIQSRGCHVIAARHLSFVEVVSCRLCKSLKADAETEGECCTSASHLQAHVIALTHDAPTSTPSSS